MATMPMKPVVLLTHGQKISAKFVIDKARISRWTYARELPNNLGSYPARSIFEIFEINRTVPVWVKAYFPNSHQTAFIKISGEELSLNFELLL